MVCVSEIIQKDSQVKLPFLHPHGPSSSYKYPGTQDIRTVLMDNILTLVGPRTKTGVSNHWTGIWNGTVEWKMEWNGEFAQLQLTRVTGAAQSRLNCLVYL